MKILFFIDRDYIGGEMESKLIYFVVSFIMYVVGIILLVKYIKIKKKQKNSIEIWGQVVNREQIGYFISEGKQYNQYLVTVEYEFNKEIRQYKYKTSSNISTVGTYVDKEILYVDKKTGDAMMTDMPPMNFLWMSLALMSATASLIIGFIL